MKELVRVAAKYNVVFNIDNIEVGESAVFVGMLIRCQKNGLPDPKNVEALLAIPIPQTRKELRQFLGLANVTLNLNMCVLVGYIFISNHRLGQLI